MKLLLLFFMIFLAGTAFTQHKHMPPMRDTKKSSGEIQKGTSKGKKPDTVNYHCPMHPEVVSDKPGKCPKCGMTLVKTTLEEIAPPASTETETNLDTDSVSFGNKTVRYDLYITHTMVNYTGKMVHAIAVNGKLPAPTLYFTEGDTAEIYLHNQLDEETSLHWHGVILPNQFDGVPYLTSKRIGPGETYLYKFKVVQNGTYWYHSHSGLQQQIGMYGALVFKKRPGQQMRKNYAADLPVILSDWTNEHPHHVMRRLQTANDWYAIKKKSTQSYTEAIRAGHLGTKLTNEWKRMNAMDVSDVYYDAFLTNGQLQSAVPAKAGDTIRLRVINGSASTYFWLNYGGGKMTVVASDGNDLKPVSVDRLIVGVSETYDVEVTIPENKKYEFRATAEDRTQSTSLWLGNGEEVKAATLPRLAYFEGMKMMNSMMKMNGDMKDMGMPMSLQTMDMNTVMYPEMQPNTGSHNNKQATYVCPMHPEVVSNKAGTCPKCGMALVSKKKTNKKKDDDHNHPMNMQQEGMVTLNYDMLQATHPTVFPKDMPVHNLHFKLEGNMNRYLWTLDNKTITEADKVLIKKGEVVRLILTNNSMMRHPMHLHGHDFRIVNSKGDYAPLKNVLDIMPMETDTLELAANQDGDWFFHCHILYHMMAGMGRVLSYENSQPNPELPDPVAAWKLFKKDNRMNAIAFNAGIETNGTEGEFNWMSSRYSLQGLWHVGYRPEHGHEFELNFGRYLGKMQWLFPYVGYDYHFQEPGTHQPGKTWFGQASNKMNRKSFVAGIQYTLPWLVVADARVDMEGRFRLQFSREDIPVTPRLRMNLMANSDKEYMGGLRYIVKKWISVSTHYDSDMGLGAGVTFTY